MIALRLPTRRNPPPADGLPRVITLRLVGSVAFDPKSDEELLRQLDLGHGPCWLKRPAIAALAEEAFVSRHGVCYSLFAWCVMPNHVHAALTLLPDQSLGDLVKSWKIATAFRANRLIGRRGLFWERDYLQSKITSGAALTAMVERIEAQPVRAKLCRTPMDWPWSSARWRRPE